MPLSVTMLVLKRRQRELLADKVPDTANLALGALVFGQFFSDRQFSLVSAVAGLALWVVLFVWAAVIAAGREGK